MVNHNADSYHRNFTAGVFYKICIFKGKKLMCYNYNQPCCGKDQCQRESAFAINLTQSYVYTGHNLLSTSDIFEALHFTDGMKNTKVGVSESNTSSSV